MSRALMPSHLSRVATLRRSHGLFRKAAFRTSAAQCAAHEFTMPAMSPTMTEGNIASWKVRDGDSYAAGDVLLEIETDKAQMDVEAQDDGVIAKIVSPDGSKGVKVGTRIAILADSGDDITSMDLSALLSAPKQDTWATKSTDDTSQEQEFSKYSEGQSSDCMDSNQAARKQTAGGPGHNLRFPHFPSVIQLLHERGVPDDERNRIPASGPNGRLLKGDVLAYLGQIKASYAADESKRIRELGHLDLSNIELVPVSERSEPSQTASDKQEQSLPLISEVSLPVSLAAVQSVRQRIKRVLGIEMSVETFIARATQLCNEGLPRSKSSPLSADDLFDGILGLSNLPKHSGGPILIPQIQSPAFIQPKSAAANSRKSDIIDELIATAPRSQSRTNKAMNKEFFEPDSSLFSVSVPKGDERRAQIFLQKFKTVLQVEPTKLVL